MKIAVIGAGLAGLTLARKLQGKASVTLFEKSRGPGGRMATRREGEYEFDHGAQFFIAKSDSFRRDAETWLQAGLVALWNPAFAELDRSTVMATRQWTEEKPHYVAVPGMNALGKHLAAGLDVVYVTTIADVRSDDGYWTLLQDNGAEHSGFDWVVMTAPAAQTAALMPPQFKHHAQLTHTKMLGCYALMLGFDTPPGKDWQCALVHNADISWVSINSSKPARPKATTVVVHSTNQYADAHMEQPIDEVEAHLHAELLAVTGIDATKARHKAIHRWRYANIAKQAGRSSLIDPENRLAACGDWCIHGRVEAAYQSAEALAQSLVPLLD